MSFLTQVPQKPPLLTQGSAGHPHVHLRLQGRLALVLPVTGLFMGSPSALSGDNIAVQRGQVASLRSPGWKGGEQSPISKPSPRPLSADLGCRDLQD